MAEVFIRRVQMSRQQPWRWRYLYPGVIRVDRATRWGNPWQVTPSDQPGMWAVIGPKASGVVRGKRQAQDMAVSLFRGILFGGTEKEQLDVLGFTARQVRAELAGVILACWCGLEDPCHADPLWDLANGGIR